MKYIPTDIKITDDQTWARVSAYESPTDHIATINRLISELPSNGFISEKVEAGLYYLVLDCKLDERSLDNAMSSVLTKDHLPFSLTVNDLKEEALGYVPFGLSLDSENYFNFLNGEFIIFVIVDMNELNRMVAESNITVEFSDRDEFPWKISPIAVKDENKDAQIFIGSHVLGRFASEFISLNWLVKNIALGPGVDEIKKVIENRN